MSDRPEDTRIGAYAPGKYWDRCVHCGGTFMGDKRAMYCRGCALASAERKSAAPSPSLPPNPHLDELTALSQEIGLYDTPGTGALREAVAAALEHFEPLICKVWRDAEWVDDGEGFKYLQKAGFVRRLVAPEKLIDAVNAARLAAGLPPRTPKPCEISPETAALSSAQGSTTEGRE